MISPLRLAALGLLALIPWTAFEAAIDGGRPAFLASPALADDDDDDDDRGGRRGGGFAPRFSFDDDDDGPRRFAPRFSYEDDDDDDRPRYRPAPRERRAARPAPRQRARPEIVASGVDAAALDRIRAAGFRVLAERRLTILPEATVRLAPPRNLSDARARARIAELATGATVDVNAIYRPNARAACAPGACFPYSRDDWKVAACGARGTVGMIDTRVDAGHGALSGRTVESLVSRGDGRQPSSTAHGTEVAILLAGDEDPSGDLTIVAVDAFHRAGGADRADVFDLVSAIDMLAQRKVGVVNLSLAGPANELLDRAGKKAAEGGMLLVAAVGNEGPKAKPRFPSAYPWAIAVTAIDAKGEPYSRAGRGEHVAFAAPGVRLELPDSSLKPGKTRSGTSYAAPLVAAALSAIRAEGGEVPVKEAIEALADHVEDKGAPGRDPVFGWGALTSARGCPTTAALSAGR